MSFLRYIEDNRYVIALGVVLMLFAALIMVISSEGTYDADDILYMLLGCSVFIGIFLAGGYYFHYSHYNALDELVRNGGEDLFAFVPRPLSHEQRLYTELARKLHQSKLEADRTFYDERKDYQDFILSWIHEVKLPITACHLLIRNSSGRSTEELANKLEDEVNKIDHYVEQALYYSRIDSFSRDYLIVEVSLNQILQGSVRKYAKLFVAKRIRFSMWEDVQTVHSDSKWLGFIMDQLITNALKYTEHGDSVTCTFEEDPHEKRLTIRDTGVGIREEELGRIFDKGFTGTNGRNDAKSTGMGLYLASRMAMKLGHRLSVRSEEGSYTELTIIFPKSRSIYQTFRLSPPSL